MFDAEEMPDSPLEKAMMLQNMVVALAENGNINDAAYLELRTEFMQPDTRNLLPEFIRTCRDQGQLWGYLKKVASGTGAWQARRTHIYDEFQPLLNHLEPEGETVTAYGGQWKLDHGLYNLIVSGEMDEWAKGSVTLPSDRFLEHTSPDVAAKFKPLNEQERKLLTSLPTVVIAEIGGSDGIFVQLNDVAMRQGKMRAKFEILEGAGTVSMEHLMEHPFEFDFGSNEQYRTHWAVKKVNLVEAMNETGLGGVTIPDVRKEPLEEPVNPWPAPPASGIAVSRATVVYQLDTLLFALSQNIEQADSRSNTPPAFDLALGGTQNFWRKFVG